MNTVADTTQVPRPDLPASNVDAPLTGTYPETVDTASLQTLDYAGAAVATLMTLMPLAMAAIGAGG